MKPKRIHPRWKYLQQLEKKKQRMQNLFSFGLGTIIVGVFFGLLGLLFYFGGTHEHIAETRGGPHYIPEQPPGMPHFLVLVVAGGIITLAGVLLIVISKVIGFCFREKAPYERLNEQ
jgi:membrane protease YdiL (CAAX protease family)